MPRMRENVMPVNDPLRKSLGWKSGHLALETTDRRFLKNLVQSFFNRIFGFWSEIVVAKLKPQTSFTLPSEIRVT